jgi:hypothetical protein
LAVLTLALLRLALSPFGLGLVLRIPGLQLHAGTLHIGLRRIWGRDVALASLRGEPVLSAAAFDLRWEGGLTLSLEKPFFRVVRGAAGSWSIPGIAASTGERAAVGPKNAAVLPKNLRLQLVVLDGRVVIDQPTLIDRSARSIALDRMTLAAALDSEHRSTYRLRGEMAGHPFIAQGLIDAERGQAFHRVTTPAMPVAPALNALIDSDAFKVEGGMLRHLELTVRGRGRRGEAVLGDSLSGTSAIDGFAARVGGLAQPLRDLSGDLTFSSDAVTFDRVRGRIAAMPFTASGAVFDFACPQVRISADGSGRLEGMRGLFSFAKNLPISGEIASHSTIEGVAASPMVVVDLDPTALRYAAFPVTLRRGSVLAYGNGVDLADIDLVYGAIDLQSTGTIALGDRVLPAVTIDARAPSSGLPYLARLFGGTTEAVVVLGGTGGALEGRAVIEGRDGARHLQGLLHLDGAGQGIVGPLSITEGPRTRLLLGGTLDRPRNAFLGVVHAEDAAITAAHAKLPGLELPVLPSLAATVGGDLALAGDYRASRIMIDLRGGRLDGVRLAGVQLGSLSGRATIAEGNISVTGVAGVNGGTVLAGGDLAHGLGLSWDGVHGIAPFSEAILAGGALLQREGVRMWANGALRVDHLPIDGFPFSASTLFRADPSTVHLTGGEVQAPGLAMEVEGSVDRLNEGGRLDLGARVFTASAATLARYLVPQSRSLEPAGSAEGELRLRGTPRAPSLTGNLQMPEGRFDGLAFRRAQVQLEAAPGRLRLQGGRVMVGSTAVRLGGMYAGERLRSEVAASHANLADFNGLFDEDDMLAGTGGLRISAAMGGDTIQTSADIDFTRVRVSDFNLGRTAAHWRSRGREVNGSVNIAGASGELAIIGGLQLPAVRPASHPLTRSRLNLSGSARDIDLARWLPALDLSAPVTGRLDIAGHAAGSLPKLTADFAIDAHGVTAGPLPIDDVRAHLSARNGRGVLEAAHAVVEGGTLDATGSFGFSPVDPLDLAVTARAPSIGTLASGIVSVLHNSQTTEALRAFGPLDGSASMVLAVKGSAMKPRLQSLFDIEQATLHGVALPRVVGSFGVSGKGLEVSDAEIAFAKGRVTASGSLPLVLSPFAIGPGAAPLSLDLAADSVDLSSFTPLLPPKSHLQGMLDGTIALAGTPASPQLFGVLRLDGGAFSSPLESIPVQNAQSILRLNGRAAKLTAGATVGGGAVEFDGKASVANLTAIGTGTDYRLRASAKQAKFEVANFGHGTLDGGVSISHHGEGVPHVAGRLALSDAQIPFSAFLLPTAGGAGVSDSLLARTTLGLQLSAGKNTRVHSGGIDLGVSGSALLSGTIGKPKLDGVFTSEGGSLAYLNHLFHVSSARVAFDPAEGINPQLAATAMTTTQNPDRNTVYNTSGHVTITLHATGSLDRMNVALTSDPAYDRQQILGLLLDVPLLGAMQFQQPSSSSAGGGNGLNVPTASANSGQFSVSEEAFSVVDAQLSQSLLAPLSSALGGAVGLSDLAVDFDRSGALALSARRHIAGNVYAFFRDSIGVPTKQSLGVDFAPNDATAVSVSLFQEQGVSTLGTPSTLGAASSTLGTASSTVGGAVTSGVSFSLSRRFP